MSETHIQLSSNTAVAFGPHVSNSVLPQISNAKLHTVVSTPHPPLQVQGRLLEMKLSHPTTNSQLPSMHCTRVRSSLRQSYAPFGAGMEQFPFHSQPPLNAPWPPFALPSPQLAMSIAAHNKMSLTSRGLPIRPIGIRYSRFFQASWRSRVGERVRSASVRAYPR